MPRSPFELRIKRLETAILPGGRKIIIIHEENSAVLFAEGESYPLAILDTWRAQGHTLIIQEIPAGYLGPLC